MIDFYDQTKSISEVNKKFGTEIKSFKYGLPIPNMNPFIKGYDDLKEEANPVELTSV